MKKTFLRLVLLGLFGLLVVAQGTFAAPPAGEAVVIVVNKTKDE
jgi:hypothetical protein